MIYFTTGILVGGSLLYYFPKFSDLLPNISTKIEDYKTTESSNNPSNE